MYSMCRWVWYFGMVGILKSWLESGDVFGVENCFYFCKINFKYQIWATMANLLYILIELSHRTLMPCIFMFDYSYNFSMILVRFCSVLNLILQHHHFTKIYPFLPRWVNTFFNAWVASFILHYPFFLFMLNIFLFSIFKRFKKLF